jgi:hypothetical protein
MPDKCYYPDLQNPEEEKLCYQDGFPRKPGLD